MKRLIALVATWGLAAILPVAAQEAPTAEQIVERSLKAFFYQGDDFKTKVTMELFDQAGHKRTRVLTMLRKNAAGGWNQKYFIYFHEPGDVRGITFMVWKYPGKEDDRWIFVPAVDLVRRIAASDKRSSFVGSDFTYEDVSGRDLDADTHSLLRSERLGERDCYVIQSVPKEPLEYAKKIAWIARDIYLPVKEEYYSAQGELLKVFSADRIDNLSGAKATFPTVLKRTMKNLKTGHRTEVTFGTAVYNVGLKDDDFSERYMRNPVRSWIE